MYLFLILFLGVGYFFMYLVPSSIGPWFIDFKDMKKDIIRFKKWLCEPMS